MQRRQTKHVHTSRGSLVDAFKVERGFLEQPEMVVARFLGICPPLDYSEPGRPEKSLCFVERVLVGSLDADVLVPFDSHAATAILEGDVLVCGDVGLCSPVTQLYQPSCSVSILWTT